MLIRQLCALGVAAASSTLACTVVDPLYCDENMQCTDPDRPFCDLAGEYPASDGVARTCIPEPNGDAGDDDGAGDDGDGDGDDGGDPDAGGPQVLRDGLVAITETTITNPPINVDDPPVQGAVVSVSFIDKSRATVPPAEGFESPIDGCEVFVYDMTAGDFEPTPVDEGVITVAGTANGDFTCAFNGESSEYACQSVNEVTAGGVSGNAAGGNIDLGEAVFVIFGMKTPPVDRSAIVGSQMLLTGFGNSSLDDKVFGVVDTAGDQTVVLAQDGPLPPDGYQTPDTATFTTFIGAGPIPNDINVNGSLYNFMTGDSELVVYSAGSKVVPSFGGTFVPEGEGLELLRDPGDRIFLPHEIPTAVPAEFPVIFACQGEGCGSTGSGGEKTAMIVTGRTTDRPLPAPQDDPMGTAMPSPMAAYATFTCIVDVSDGKNEARMSAEALDLILGTDPTRIETTVLRAQVFLDITSESEMAETSLFVGHSLTGYTTVEAPPELARSAE